MNVRKMLVMLCLVALASIGFSANAYAKAMAATEDSAYVEIDPLWEHTTLITVNLPITNGRAILAGSVIGNTGTTSISVNAVLERVNPNGTFTHIVSFNNIRANGDIWVWERPHYVARGHYYRLTLTATVFRHGTSEVVSVSQTTRAN